MSSRSLVLHAVGDVSLGDHPLCTGFGTHSRARKRAPTFPFEHVAPVFRDADLVFGNLECTLSETGLMKGELKSIQMRGHAAYLDGLRQAGFSVVNMANNHAMQHGRVPFGETVAMLRKAGIGAAGVATAADYRNAAPEVLEKNGLKVAFLGYSLRPRQYFTEEPAYAEGYRDHILDDVRKARAANDNVVVSLHWGDEFIDRPSPDEMKLAHEIMDAGADLIIGHHPHVMRGVEKYGRGYIVYSLGNFVCDMLWEDQLRETAIVKCRLTPEGVAELSLVPVRINDDYQPVPLQGEKARALDARIAALSEALPAAVATPETMEQYQVSADEAHRISRKKSHLYFIRKAYRFPPAIVFQQIRTFVRNRLAERGLARPSQAASGPGC
jgi:poly-gamma-glutamate synthesis protein (capsule biosynthesis protein)